MSKLHTSVCACEEEWFIDLQQSQKMLAIVKIENENNSDNYHHKCIIKKNILIVPFTLLFLQVPSGQVRDRHTMIITQVRDRHTMIIT